MRLSTRSRYGTRMLLDIAINGKIHPVRIVDVAERQLISVKYLEKLVRELKMAGYVASKRGPRGGHVIARPPEDIRIGDLVRVLEGEIGLTRCVETGKVCTREIKCIMHGVWEMASDEMFNALNTVTLADLMRKYDQFMLEAASLKEGTKCPGMPEK